MGTPPSAGHSVVRPWAARAVGRGEVLSLIKLWNLLFMQGSALSETQCEKPTCPHRYTPNLSIFCDQVE